MFILPVMLFDRASMFNRRERKYDGNFHCFEQYESPGQDTRSLLMEAAQTYSGGMVPTQSLHTLLFSIVAFPRILRPEGG